MELRLITYNLRPNYVHTYMNSSVKKVIRLGSRLVLSIFLLLLLFVLSVYFGAWGKLPSKTELSSLEYQKASEVYSADSVLIGKFYLFDRQPIPFENMPDHLISSLIAIEDRRFYEHKGIDYKSLIRVGLKTILLGDTSSGGGSTLSQQLAKNLYPRDTGGRFDLAVDKLQEMFTARRLESIFSKEELLEHYLNTVSFGDNTFGVESASLRFFGKTADSLEIEEAAVLTGMLKATYSYNPRIFPERSKDRRNVVIRAMEDIGKLSEEEADSLAGLPLVLNYKNYDHNQGIAPYFREEVRKKMENWCRQQREAGEDVNLYTSGLKIYTTLDYSMQELAEKTMSKHMSSLQLAFEKSYGSKAPWLTNKKLIRKLIRNSEAYQKLLDDGLGHEQAWDKIHQTRTMSLMDWDGEFTSEASVADSLIHYVKFLNTGSLSIDPANGAVRTWIGGIDFQHFKYDHISQSKRQPGSCFKPIVYTAALEEGIQPCTHFSAREVEYNNLEDWSPANSSDKNESFLNYSMEEALSNSVNTVSVKILEKTGIEQVISMAQKMGIQSELPHQPSLALGTGEVAIDELAGAYASYVNNGKPVSPYLINTVLDNDGNMLADFSERKALPEAFSEESRAVMIELMKSVVDKGTAARIRNRYQLNNDIAGKTGTTQKNKDAWFVAITPAIVHVSWVGLDHHEIGFKNTTIGQGANAALPLFALWMQELNKRKEFNKITRAKFKSPNPQIAATLDCDPVVKDNFFKRLFKNPNKKKKRKFKG